MPIQLLSAGPTQAITQNVVYALPASRVLMYAQTGTFVTSDDVGMAATTSVTLSNGQAELAAQFIKCTSGNVNITLKKA